MRKKKMKIKDCKDECIRLSDHMDLSKYSLEGHLLGCEAIISGLTFWKRLKFLFCSCPNIETLDLKILSIKDYNLCLVKNEEKSLQKD